MTIVDPLPPPRLVARGLFAVTPSCLGFGCASLGSRVGSREGLAALHEAFEAGITWFDVAPAYGAGRAEDLLATFLRGRRDEIVVATKVGLTAARGPARSMLGLALGAARLVPGAKQGLRKLARRTRATTARRVAIDGAAIDHAIVASLTRLRTDRVDVYALHDPEPAVVGRDDIIRALERALARGQALHVAVAGDAAACDAARAVGRPYTILQTNAEALATGALSEDAGFIRVAHSVFGVDGLRDRLLARLADGRHRRLLAAAGYDGDVARAASDLLLDAAFATNPEGIVLASMMAPKHRAANLRRADRLRPEAPALLRTLLA